MSFEIHPRLAFDTSFVADWPLCRVLLMEDARYFWLVLVPRLFTSPEAAQNSAAGAEGENWVRDITDLSAEERGLMMEEAARAGQIIKDAGAVKLNIGALGNIVPQFHMHVLGRDPADPAWPGPVWNHSAPVPYDPAARAARISLVRSG